MTSLITNSSAMTALTTLKGVARQLDVASNRVSTGLRVTTASDNAAYWSIATTVRTDTASLSAVKDSLGLGASAVDTAYNGLNAIISDLQNLRAKLQSALTPGIDRAKIQTEIAAIQFKMKATADSSNASGRNWLSVDSSPTNTDYQATQKVVAGFSRGVNGNVTFSTVDVDVSAIKLYDANVASVATAATAAEVVGSTALTGTAVFRPGTADAGTADFSGTNEVPLSVTLVDGTTTTVSIVIDRTTMQSAVKDLTKVTTQEFVTAINNQIIDSIGANKVTAALDSAGRVMFQSAGTGSGISLSVNGMAPSIGNTFADVGFALTAPIPPGPARIVATSNYSNIDLNSLYIPISISENGAAFGFYIYSSNYYALATKISSGINSVNGTDMAAMITNVLLSTGISNTTVSFSEGKIALTNSNVGPSAYVYISSVPELGFTSSQSANGTAAIVGIPTPHVGYGTASGTSGGRGILDTVDASTNTSIAMIDISSLSGTDGDDTLSALVAQVDKTISGITEAGTKLGAKKTQIEGQTAFIGTLIKANDRMIGILVDADVEEESTKLKALQTQQQLAMQALSIANSSGQGVLSLSR
ncbi:flagellin [Methylobacterium frigidaeris]|nr:flagellin [Methylobacterium frigidaeris]PIK69915.1 flagellin [Methylobacterium frigidaeris]